jgi:K+-transporting ATPase KdpF subunit
MNSIIIAITNRAFEMNSPTGYMIGAVIAIIILGYLLYSLVRPERF